MADTSGGWLSNVLDAASFSCILVAIEEYGRSVAKAGPTMPLYAQLGFGIAGVTLSFLGKQGPKRWRKISNSITGKSLKEENTKLMAELAAFKNQPTTAVATARPGVPPNAEDFVWRWRKMITDVQNMGAHPAVPLAGHQDYRSLRPHLNDATKQAIEGPQTPEISVFPPVVHPILTNLSEVVEKLARTWGLPNELTQLPEIIEEYPWPVFNAEVTVDEKANDPLIIFKDKVRILLSNVTAKEIHVWTPIWQSDQVEAQFPLVTPSGSQFIVPAAPGSRFRLKKSGGNWIAETQPDGSFKVLEYSRVELKPGDVCDCYVGLDPRKNQNLKEMWRTRSPIGTALFPLKIEGKLYVKSVRC